MVSRIRAALLVQLVASILVIKDALAEPLAVKAAIHSQIERPNRFYQTFKAWLTGLLEAVSNQSASCWCQLDQQPADGRLAAGNPAG